MSRATRRAQARKALAAEPAALAPAARSGAGRARETGWWLALVVVCPFLYLRGIMNVAELPRFIGLSAYLLVFVLYVEVLRPRPGVERARRGLTRALGGLAGAFLAVQVAASFSAVNRQAALFSTVQQGLVLLAALLFFRTVRREEGSSLRLSKALALVLIAQALVGILQFYGLAFTDLISVKRATPYGLMGNRNLFSSFLALLLPFPAYLLHAGSRAWKGVAAGALGLGLYGVVIGQTRSAWVALAAALLASNGLVLLLRRRLGAALVRGWLLGTAAFVAGAALAVGCAVTLPGQPKLAAALAARAGDLLDASSEGETAGSIQLRLALWRQSWEMMRERPLLGVGPGNWRVVAPRYGLLLPEALHGGTTVPDRAHNVYLQTGAEAGAIGLLVYLALLGVATAIAIRLVVEPASDGARLLGIVSLAVLCTYAVDSAFSFPNEIVSHSLVLALTVGMVAGVHENRSRPPSVPADRPAGRRAPWLAACGFSLFSLYLGYAKARFEHHNLRARAFEKLRQPRKVLEEVRRGRTPLVTVSPYGDPLEMYGAQAHSDLGDLDEALAAIRRARELSPWSVQVEHRVGNVYARMHRWEEASRWYLEALGKAPEFNLALRNLGVAYYNRGMFKECCDALGRADIDDSEKLAMTLATAQLKLERWDDAVATLRRGLERFPDSAELLEQLAYVEYVHLKDLAGAREHLLRLLELRPDHPRRDEYGRVIAYAAQKVGGPPGEPSSPGGTEPAPPRR